jgi:hypothetical protein
MKQQHITAAAHLPATVNAHPKVFSPVFCSSCSISFPQQLIPTTLLSHQLFQPIHPPSIPYPSDILINASNQQSYVQQRYPPCVSPLPPASSLDLPPSVPPRPPTRSSSLLTPRAMPRLYQPISHPSRATGTSAATQATTAPTTKGMVPSLVLPVLWPLVNLWTARGVKNPVLAQYVKPLAPFHYRLSCSHLLRLLGLLFHVPWLRTLPMLRSGRGRAPVR